MGVMDDSLVLSQIPAVATGRFDGFDLEDRPLVSQLPQLPGRVVPARATVALTQAMIGRDVVIVYENGDPQRPIVLGVMQGTGRTDAAREAAPAQAPEQTLTAQVDNERLVLTAEREVVLRCGEASITLTRAGRVVIKGKYLLSRATGYNKIKGATVEMN